MKRFKVDDIIKYRGYKYRIYNVGKNWYDVDAIPPYDEDGRVTCIGFAAQDNMTLADKDEQMTVAEFIYELQKFNPYTKVCIGDNFNNRVSIGWSGADGFGSKRGCDYVCLDVAGNEEK